MSVRMEGSGQHDGSGMTESRRSYYVLLLLTLAYALAYVDRQMLNLLVDPIKRSLVISDTQFSFVQGTAFVVAYLCAAPLFGRLVDITNRRNILIFGVSIWSICTALCGAVDSFPKLFVARLGVGVSEACIVPVAMSLIGDYFSARRLARAQSIFYIGVQLGGGVALLSGGIIIAFADGMRRSVSSLAVLETWQMAFVVVGLPGLLFALLLLTLKEPERRNSLVDTGPDRQLAMREVWGILWAKRQFYGRLYLAIGMIAIVQLGMPSWFPAFLIRARGLTPAETGVQLGGLSVIVGTIGTLLGPSVADWFRNRGYSDAPLRVSAYSAVLMFVSCCAIPLAPGRIGALVAAAGVFFSTGLPLGIIAAAMQGATPNRMRGVVAAIYTFASQIIGYMIGPTLIALCTDRLFGNPKMVGFSMQIVMGGASAMAVLLLASALPHYRRLVASATDQP